MAPSVVTQRRLAWAAFGSGSGMLLGSIPVSIWLLSDTFWSPIAQTLLWLALPVAGMLIARREPGNRIAWILLAIGAVIGFGTLAEPYTTYGIARHPGSLPAAGVVAAISGSLWVPAIGLTGTYLILLFPDGRLPSRRWRPLAWVSGITMGLLVLVFIFGPVSFEQNPKVRNPVAIAALKPVLSLVLVALPALPLCMLGCAVGLAVRFRRSRGIERLQLKWLATAGAFVTSVYLVMMVLSLIYNRPGGSSAPGWLDVLDHVAVATFVLIPVAIAIAVLKHGLYGIDRLISRTVSYAVVTGTLLAVYVALVTVGSRLTPSGNPLGVAASTLAVAALFQPLRRRVQTAVDRRFNRARYDADRTVAAFTRRLRQEVDLEAVRSDLMHVVHETLQPASAGLWLRDVTR